MSLYRYTDWLLVWYKPSCIDVPTYGMMGYTNISIWTACTNILLDRHILSIPSGTVRYGEP